ncbi:MAG: NifB/NifX family molybdenum-iron cluster-binding protein [Desulfovibrionaceae bacterium]|nr:NifB/NifX family molybdenum-iron cluster-binding protein [Desulfovibrionaceae bacterium]
MIVCLAAYGPRLATLFDTAERFDLLEIDADGSITPLGRLPLHGGDPAQIPGLLAAHGVSCAICGGIGCGLHRRLAAAGIRVIPWICGDTEGVARAFCDGNLDEWRMPGCPGPGMGPGRGMGRGCGRGMGRAAQQGRGLDAAQGPGATQGPDGGPDGGRGGPGGLGPRCRRRLNNPDNQGESS